MKQFELERVDRKERYIFTEEICLGSNDSISQGFTDTDLSDFEELCFSVTSEDVSEAVLTLRLMNPDYKRRTRPRCHYYAKIKLDFVGKRDFSLSLFKDFVRYEYATLKDIVSFNCELVGEGGARVEGLCLVGYEYAYKNGYAPGDADYDRVKENWILTLIGSKDRDGRLDAHREKLDALSRACREAREALMPDIRGEGGILMAYDHTPGEEFSYNQFFSKIYAMVEGYATPGAELYHDGELLADVITIIDKATEKLYSLEFLKDGCYGNWWTWQIGIPLYLCPTLLLLEKELGEERIGLILSSIDYLVPWPAMTAANRLWLSKACFASALLRRDGKYIIRAREMLNEVFDYVTTGDGFYRDGSFIQHKYHSYTGGYGLTVISLAAFYMNIFGNTPFEFKSEVTENHYAWFFENFRPMVYKNTMFSACRGREVSRKNGEESSHKYLLSTVLCATVYAQGERLERLKAMAKYMLISSGGEKMLRQLPFWLINRASEILSDEGVKSDDGFSGFYTFGNMDLCAMHSEKYGACLKLSSERIQKFEALNRENMKGWYQGDGVLYRYDGSYLYNWEYFTKMNPYLYPGTTVSLVKREEIDQGHIFNASSFSGGATLGECGCAAFQLLYPKNNNFFDTDITAKKSWFFFEEEILALGSDISDSRGEEVVTVVENRRLNDGDTLSICTPEGEGKRDNNSVIESQNLPLCHLTGGGGYLFSIPTAYDASDNYCLHSSQENGGRATNLVFRAGEVGAIKINRTEGEPSFLEITISHGASPKGAGYSYCHLPSYTKTECEKYLNRPTVAVLERSSAAHTVVKLTESGEIYLGSVIFKPCQGSLIYSSEALCLMIKISMDGIKIAASDPTHRLKRAEITLDLERLKQMLYRVLFPEMGAVGEGMTYFMGLSAACRESVQEMLSDLVASLPLTPLKCTYRGERICAVSHQGGAQKLTLDLSGNRGESVVTELSFKK